MVVMEILKEVTHWNASAQSNHTYLLNHKNQIIAYAKWHTDDVQVLKTPISIDKRYRKFEKSNHAKLSLIANQLDNKIPNHIRVFEVKSKDKTYNVTYNNKTKRLSCDCLGFNYRHQCKHSEAVAKSIGI
jgi:hypothetical protein